MKAINRIYQYFEYKKIKPTRFEKEVEISNGYFGTQLKRNSNLGEGVLSKILTSCADLNPSWLLTGEGSMLKAGVGESEANKSEVAVAENPLTYRAAIPLIPFEAVAAWDAKQVQRAAHKTPGYVIPEFDELKVDFMVKIKGDDMYPKYSSGDLVACKKLPLDTFFQWNKVYVLETVQGVILKRVEQSQLEKHINCVSYNSHYKPFDLRLEEVRCLALVLGAIHF